MLRCQAGNDIPDGCTFRWKIKKIQGLFKWASASFLLLLSKSFPWRCNWDPPATYAFPGWGIPTARRYRLWLKQYDISCRVAYSTCLGGGLTLHWDKMLGNAESSPARRFLPSPVAINSRIGLNRDDHLFIATAQVFASPGKFLPKQQDRIRTVACRRLQYVWF